MENCGTGTHVLYNFLHNFCSTIVLTPGTGTVVDMTAHYVATRSLVRSFYYSKYNSGGACAVYCHIKYQ